MFKLALVLSALVAVAVSSPLGFGLGAPLLSKVSYETPEVKHIQPEVTVQAPEYRYKAVPYAVPYSVPQPVVQYVAPQPMAYTAAVTAPQPVAYTTAVAAPQPLAYAAPGFPYTGYFPYSAPVAVEIKKN